MNRPLLNDPAQFPDDLILSRELGKAKAAWDEFQAMLRRDYPPLAAEWQYYNDGKSWLCKVRRKDKTICWISVWRRFFKVTFYLNSRAEPLVRDSALAPALKDAFLCPAATTRFRHIGVDVRFRSALKPLKELIEIKLKVT